MATVTDTAVGRLAPPRQRTYDLGTRLADYEVGVLDPDQTLHLFADLISTGLAWRLQGHYGRTAAAYIDAGVIDALGRIKQEEAK